MCHSNKTMCGNQCSFVDEARRHKRLDTFQTTVTTVITNQTLKQNPICVSLIAIYLAIYLYLDIYPSIYLAMSIAHLQFQLLAKPCLPCQQHRQP